MRRKTGLVIFSVLALLAVASISRAQTTYEDPQGRFAIDLPKGWQLDPQTEDILFVFKGEGKSIIIEYVSGVNDAGALMKKAQATLVASGLTNPVLDGDLMEMTINGHPARWGVYKSGKLLASLCGTAILGDNGLYFMSIMAAGAVTSWKDRMEKSFQSIRMPGEAVTGAAEAKAATATPADATAGSPTPWKSDLVSLTLPPGWSEKPKPRGFEKEVKGWFMNDNLPGATLMVVCYKGMGMTMSKAFDAGVKSVTIPMPGMKPVEAEEMTLENGKVNFAVYKGLGAAGGTEIELASVIITTKAAKGLTNLIMTGLGSYLPELRAQALETAKSVK